METIGSDSQQAMRGLNTVSSTVSIETAFESLAEVGSTNQLQELYEELSGSTHVLRQGGVPEKFRQWLLGSIKISYGKSAREDIFSGPRELSSLVRQFQANRLEVLMQLSGNTFTAKQLSLTHRLVNCGIGSRLRYHRDYNGAERSPSVEVWNLLGQASYTIGFSANESEAESFELDTGDRLVFNGGDVGGAQPYHGVYIPSGQDTPRIVLLMTNYASCLQRYALE